jgi:O-6-methylguanine DNA methyltransferase
MNTNDALPRSHSGPVVGVKTTRIYCRPTCRPGREPRPENCVPFADAAAARAAGFRACKKCRPDDDARATETGVSVRYGVGPSRLGWLFVAETGSGVCGLYLLDDADPSPALVRLLRDVPGAAAERDDAVAERLIPSVEAYVAEGAPFEHPLDQFGTPFQKRVWDGLCAIPWGETTTYGGLAAALGLPAGSARAVGTACGSNPVSLVVPCHRVVRAGGGLGGYGWGLPRKQALLEMEGATPCRAGEAQCEGSLTSLTAVP